MDWKRRGMPFYYGIGGKIAIDPKKKAIACARACVDKKADEVMVLDMRKVSNFTDYFVICAGDSMRQTRAIADNVLEKLEASQLRAWHVEGYVEASWILLDYSDVVVHVFYKDLREFYSLERLWADAPKEVIGDA